MNIREDIGPVVLDYLFRSLQIDAQWSLRESRGFTWWPYRLRQRVWVEPARLDADYAIVRVHAESSLLKDVPNSQSSLERVNALNASDASMSAYVFEPGEQRLVMHCAADFHQGNAQWLSALFSGAAAIQAADAHITAERAAAALGARPDETGHPRGGMRKKPDGMLSVIDIFFAPEGRGPSAFGDVDFADVLAMEPAPWVLADAGQRGMTAQFPQMISAPPPEMGTLRNVFSVKKASDFPSGEKNAPVAPSVPGTALACNSSSGRK